MSMARDERGLAAGRNLASLRATFSRTPQPRSEQSQERTRRAPAAETPKRSIYTVDIEKRQSKYNLFDLFSKPKVQTLRGYHEQDVEYNTAGSHRSRPTYPDHVRPAEVGSKTETPSRPNIAAQTTHLRARPQVQRQPKPRNDWHVLPLFQAYPQAVKHGGLKSPAVSTESLLRTYAFRQQVGMVGNASSLPFVQEETEEMQAHVGAKLVSKRYSTLNDPPDLVDKVFVLVTSGRLIQYTGNGNHDRLPEKVLELGAQSAAFVCDLVPGKHWVVQVVNQVDLPGASVMRKSRSLISRLRRPAAMAGLGSRVSSTSLLLVFSCSEDMTSWLHAIKHVIEQQGGGKREDSAEAKTIESTPGESPEYLGHHSRVSRIPEKLSIPTTQHRPRSAASFSRPRSPRSPQTPIDTALPPVPSDLHRQHHSTPLDPMTDGKFANTENQAPKSTTSESSSVGASVSSIGQIKLDALREESRDSVASNQTSHTSDSEYVTATASKDSSLLLASHSDDLVVQKHDPRLITLHTSYIAPLGGATRLSGKSKPAAFAHNGHFDLDAKGQQAARSDVEGSNLQSPSATEREREVKAFPSPDKWRPDMQPPRVPLRRDSARVSPKALRPESSIGQISVTATRPRDRADSSARQRRPSSRILPVRPSFSASGAESPVRRRRLSSVPTQSTNPFAASNSLPGVEQGSGSPVPPRRLSSLPQSFINAPPSNSILEDEEVEDASPSTLNISLPVGSAMRSSPFGRIVANARLRQPDLTPSKSSQSRLSNVRPQGDSASLSPDRQPTAFARSNAATTNRNSYFTDYLPNSDALSTPPQKQTNTTSTGATFSTTPSTTPSTARSTTTAETPRPTFTLFPRPIPESSPSSLNGLRLTPLSSERAKTYSGSQHGGAFKVTCHPLTPTNPNKPPVFKGWLSSPAELPPMKPPPPPDMPLPSLPETPAETPPSVRSRA